MEYFNDNELRCKCGCNNLQFDPAFRVILNTIRHQYGKPMVITSGYRCSKHPVEAKKPTPGSHNLGCAVDIATNSSNDRFNIIRLAMKNGVTRIGIAKNFVHIDFADRIKPTQFPANVCWDY